MRRSPALAPLLALVWVLGAVAGCPLPLDPSTPEKPKLHKEQTTGRGYWLYVPSYHSSDRTWPLVVSLHGTYGFDGGWAQATEWKYVAERYGVIVVAPRLKSVQGILPTIDSLWYSDLAKDEALVLALLDELAGKYNVDPQAVMMTGFSAGGYPLYYIGLRNPEKFQLLVARACNSSQKVFERVRAAGASKKQNAIIVWGKDDFNLIQKESWQAFAWLRTQGYKNAKRKVVEGGHFRRPQLAYELWRPYLPKKYRHAPGAD